MSASAADGASTTDNAWDEADRARLAEAMRRDGLSQEALARVLESEYGVASVRQATISRWLSGKIAQPDPYLVATLRAYCSAVGASIEPSSHEAVDPRRPTSGNGDTFERMIARETHEPLLGLEQKAFMDSYLVRLQNGPAMSDADWKAFQWVASTLFRSGT